MKVSIPKLYQRYNNSVLNVLKKIRSSKEELYLNVLKILSILDIQPHNSILLFAYFDILATITDTINPWAISCLQKNEGTRFMKTFCWTPKYLYIREQLNNMQWHKVNLESQHFEMWKTVCYE